MIGRWVGAAMLGLLCGLFAWQFTLALTPGALMALAVNRISLQGSTINRFSFGPLVTAKSRAIVRPSPDLLYSSCPFDVSSAPLKIDVPPVEAPYWSLSVFDAQTNAVFVRNNQAAAGPIRVAVVRRGQAAPTGYARVEVKESRGIALVRILIDRTRPITAIDAQRRTARCALAG